MNPNMQQQFPPISGNMTTTQMIQQQLQSTGPTGMSGGNMIPTGASMNPSAGGIQGTGAMAGNNPNMNFGQGGGQMVSGGGQMVTGTPQQQQWNSGFNQMQQQQAQQPQQPQQPFYNQQGMGGQSMYYNIY